MKNMHNKISGFTLIELMIGILVGLFIMAAVTSMTINAFKSRNDIEASAKLNQELGAVMAVMSNEIRRSGFNVCKDDCVSIEDYDDLDIDAGGSCILYRYDADANGNDDIVEQRGFRRSGNKIQMAGVAGGVACGVDAIWIDITDDNVIEITDLIFSSTESKCIDRTVNTYDYWYVDSGTATEFPCQNGLAVQLCNDANGDGEIDTDDVNECSTGNAPLAGHEFVEMRQVNIVIEGGLVGYNNSVKKTLSTSVKVANRRVGVAPPPSP